MRTCSFDGCSALACKREWCNKHYRRWLRNGDPAGVRPERMQVPEDGLCTLPDCGAPYYGQGFCKLHWQHWKRTGNALLVRPRSPRGDRNHKWRGNDVGYTAAHGRVRRARGKPSDYSCAHADGSCTGRMEWANLTGNYPDISDYAPMCASHHKRYDFARRQTA